MLHFDATQVAAITQAHFFTRVAEFVREQSPVAAYRAAASDATLRRSLWAPHWPLLRALPEHDAALFMCFVLACAALNIDVDRALEAARHAAQPPHLMKRFLAERGLLRYCAFDVPELLAGAQAG